MDEFEEHLSMENEPAAVLPPGPAPAPSELPVPLSVFAQGLRPRRQVNPRTKKTEMVPGAPDEIFLKLLKIAHNTDKRTPSAWRALIDTYRGQPAHPTVLGI